MTIYRLARLTECRAYDDAPHNTDRKIAFDPRRVVTVIEASAADEGGAWVHLATRDEWEEPADWDHRRAQHEGCRAFLTRESYMDTLAEIDFALRGMLPLHSPALAPDLSADVFSIDWSVRVRNVLKKEGIRTIGQLCALSREDLLMWRNFHLVSLREVVTRLAERGLGLRAEEAHP